MIEYLTGLDYILTNGTPRWGEKPDKVISVFGYQMKFDFKDGFPLLTTRDMTGNWKGIIRKELLWIMSGSTSSREAEEKFGLKLWNRWAEESRKKIGTPEGELGPVYGHQLRHWHGQTDQLTEVLDMLKRTPETRRAMITLWDPEDVEIGGVKKVNVANCITNLHFERINYKTQNGSYEPKLDMIMTLRSADLPAGTPIDIAVWGLFQMLFAKELNIPPGTLTVDIHDGQIYEMQIEKVKELLKREPLSRGTVTISDSPSGTIYDHRPEDFVLHNYQHLEPMLIPTAD